MLEEVLQEGGGLLDLLVDFQEFLGSFSALGEFFPADDSFLNFGVQSGQQTVQVPLRSLNPRFQKIMKGRPDHQKQVRHGLNEIPSFPRYPDLTDGPPSGKLPGSRAGARLADFKGGDDIIQRQRLGRQQQKAVDLAKRPGQPQPAGETSPHLNELKTGLGPVDRTGVIQRALRLWGGYMQADFVPVNSQPPWEWT